MGGPAEIQFGDALADDVFASLCQAVKAEAERLESKYSRYRADSTLSSINSCAGNEPVSVDAETAALIDLAAVAHNQSDGLFDPTSGVLRRVWNFSVAQLPSVQAIREVLQLVGWNKLRWKPPQLMLSLPGMELDLGGLVKEYAVDRAMAILQSHDIRNASVNFAGDVRVLGKGLSGQGWRVGIVHPRNSGQVLASLEVLNIAVATSGDYERYFELGGKRYCHILNPKTGFPVQDLQSVTVLCDSCLVAGVASTTAMLLGELKGLRYLKELGLKFVIVDKNGKVNSNLPL